MVGEEGKMVGEEGMVIVVWRRFRERDEYEDGRGCDRERDEDGLVILALFFQIFYFFN